MPLEDLGQSPGFAESAATLSFGDELLVLPNDKSDGGSRRAVSILTASCCRVAPRGVDGGGCMNEARKCRKVCCDDGMNKWPEPSL